MRRILIVLSMVVVLAVNDGDVARAQEASNSADASNKIVHEQSLAHAQRFNDPDKWCREWMANDDQLLQRDIDASNRLPFSYAVFNYPCYEHPGMMVGPINLPAPLVGAEAALAQQEPGADGQPIYDPVMMLVATGPQKLQHVDQAAISRSCPHFLFQGAMRSEAGRIDWVAMRLANGNEIGIINGRVLDLSVGNLVAVKQQSNGRIVIHQHLERLESGASDDLSSAVGRAIGQHLRTFLGL